MLVKHKQFYSRDPGAVTERILDAAEPEFLAFGYAEASTNRILEGFGGSKATLFRHYPSKAELFVAVIRRIERRVVAAADWATLDTDDPQTWLTNFARIALHSCFSDDALFVGRMVVAHGREFPVLRETFAAIALEPMLSRLTDMLRLWTREGKLASTDPEADSIRFFDLVTSGWMLRALFGIGPSLTRELAEREPGSAVMVFLEGRIPRNDADGT